LKKGCAQKSSTHFPWITVAVRKREKRKGSGGGAVTTMASQSQEVKARRGELLNLTKELLGKEFPVPIKSKSKLDIPTRFVAAAPEPLEIIITPRDYNENQSVQCPDSV